MNKINENTKFVVKIKIDKYLGIVKIVKFRRKQSQDAVVMVQWSFCFLWECEVLCYGNRCVGFFFCMEITFGK